MELKYLAEGTSLDLGGDRKKTGARILSTLCLAEAMQSEEGYQKILADELYNVFLKFIQVSSCLLYTSSGGYEGTFVLLYYLSYLGK